MTDKNVESNERNGEGRLRSGIDDNDNYDPHDHRQVEKPTTNCETLIHILKGALGTGILAMPESFKNAGYVNGIISTFLIGALCVYCTLLLINSQYLICKREKVAMLTYPQSMKLALEKGPEFLRCLAGPSVYIIDGFLVFYQLGCCCVYIVFVATNIKQIVDYNLVELDIRIHILILILPFMLIFSIRNLKWLAPFSQIANIITFVGLAMICYYLFQDIPSIKERNMVVGIGTYPLFIGTVLFALNALGVVISLESNMENPKKFGGCDGVLNIGMIIIMILYAATGFLGYLKYGDEALGSITLNIPQNEILAQVIKALFSAAIYFSFALQGYVPIEIIWRNSLRKKYPDFNDIVGEYLVRFVFIIVTFALAVAMPRLGLFISLFGAFCLPTLAIMFPAIMEVCIFYPDRYGRCNFIIIKAILLILIGFVAFASGTYTSIRDMILSFQ